MQRSQKSILNITSSILLTFCNGLLNLVMTNFILQKFGSDFNGVNSTASQLITVISLFEGGFTIATNVSLFKPYAQKDFKSVNAILYTANRTFKKIGILATIFGVFSSIVYGLIIKSNLNDSLIISIFIMTILPSCYNFYFTTKYRIILQAEQKEYIITFFTLATSSLGYILNIIFLNIGCYMWNVRFITMCTSLLNNFCIMCFVKYKYKYKQFSFIPNGLNISIPGTKDVLIQKITGVLYSFAPIFFISISSGGTLLASVYSIYNSIFSLLKTFLHAISDGPRLSLGDIASSENQEKTWYVFQKYELTNIFFLVIVLSTASVLILPFIEIYTKNIQDANYIQPNIALLLVLITYFELLHSPSGQLINMTGKFKLSKLFQLYAFFLLVILSCISFFLNVGLYGILISVFLTALLLCLFEVLFVHCFFFPKKLCHFLFMNFIFLIPNILIASIEIMVYPKPNNYLSFFLQGILLFSTHLLIGFFILTLFFKKQRNELFYSIKSMFSH